MKKWYLVAISLVGLIFYIAAIITDEKLCYLVGSIALLTQSAIQLWTAFRKK